MTYLVKSKPYRPLNLYEDFDRTLSSIFDDFPSFDARVPSVDIREEEDKYVLDAELPGLSEKDVEVKVEDNILSISSVKSEEKEEKKDGYILKERRERNFSRSFMLPKDADREKIEAVFKNGVLSLIIAKSPKSLPKTIQVKSK